MCCLQITTEYQVYNCRRIEDIGLIYRRPGVFEVTILLYSSLIVIHFFRLVWANGDNLGWQHYCLSFSSLSSIPWYLGLRGAAQFYTCDWELVFLSLGGKSLFWDHILFFSTNNIQHVSKIWNIKSQVIDVSIASKSQSHVLSSACCFRDRASVSLKCSLK